MGASQLTARTRFGLTLTALAVATGCSGGEDATEAETTAPVMVAAATSTTLAPALTPTSAVTTTLPATTTTVDEMIAAQGAYFVFASEINGATTSAWAPYPDGVPWSEAPALCAVLAPATERFANLLAGYDWPDSAQDEIDAQVAGIARDAGLYYDCAGAPGTADGQSFTWQLLEDPAAVAARSSAASATRVALGLPIDR